MKKALIAAMTEDRVIGKDGDLPWHYPEDMKHFRETTMDRPVIMGRKTYFSIPDDYRPLSGRKNIVLTRSDIETPESVEVANSLEEAWDIAESTGKEIAFVIGGSSIYEQTLGKVDEMVITEVHESYEGDSYFPEWSEENWEEVERDDREEISFVRYKRV